jgi:hypothetical protein
MIPRHGSSLGTAMKSKAPDLGPNRGLGHSHSQCAISRQRGLAFSDIRHKMSLPALREKIGRSR